MAKKSKTQTAGNSNGSFGATKAERIEALKSRVGPQGQKRAEKLLTEENVDVLRLVSLQIPPTNRWSPNRLGDRVEGWLSNLPKEEATAVREKLLKAKRTTKTA